MGAALDSEVLQSTSSKFVDVSYCEAESLTFVLALENQIALSLKMESLSQSEQILQQHIDKLQTEVAECREMLSTIVAQTRETPQLTELQSELKLVKSLLLSKSQFPTVSTTTKTVVPPWQLKSQPEAQTIDSSSPEQ